MGSWWTGSHEPAAGLRHDAAIFNKCFAAANRPPHYAAERLADVWADRVTLLQIRWPQRRRGIESDECDIGVVACAQHSFVRDIESRGRVGREQRRQAR